MAEDPSARYLDELTARLRLPEPYAREVREEIAAHLADTRDGLLAEGLTDEQAEREAIARLGSASVLADELRRTHQTRRRLLAGAAGGVYAAGGQAIAGTIMGFAVLILGTLVLAILGSLLGRAGFGLDLSFGGSIPSSSWQTFIGSLAMAIGAFFAGRAAVRASAATSRRQERSLTRWWGAVGSVVIVAWLLIVWEASLSWPAVVAELLIPVAFVAGTRFRVERAAPRVRHGTALAVGILALSLLLPFGLLVFATSEVSSSGESKVSGPYLSIEAMWHARGWDRVGAVPPEAVRAYVTDLDWQGERQPLRPSVQAGTAVLAGWRDFRYEAWVPAADEADIPASSAGPFAVAPATLANGRISGTIRVDRTPGVTEYALFLTGVGPDGQRYLLSGPALGQTAFFGTLWDWLVAQ